jgi:signal peptidase I
MIEVDLNTRILPRDHEIFFARPGSGYRLYADFVAESAVFVDLPGLELVPGLPFSQQEFINRKIHRARALREWHRWGRDTPRPSADLRDYPSGVGDAGVAQHRSALLGYFERAKKGDLVLVSPAAYSFPAYIGEFVGEPSEIVSFRVPRFYENDLLQGRQVRWLGTILKRFLSQTILDIVSKPNIFVTLPRSVRRDLYELVYNGFTFAGDFSIRFDVTAQDFTAYDDLLIQQFVNYVAVNTLALSQDGDGVVRSLRDAVFRDAGAFTPELRAEVSSPGFLNLYSSQITPLVVAALFAIALTVGPTAFQAAQNDMVRIGNSQAPADDACVADVHRQALNQIRLSGAHGWAEACEKAREAARRTGVQGPARVRQ